jgi:hypothetical protein
MRNAVIAACTILTITTLCDNARARGGAGMRARPSTGVPHMGSRIIGHSSRGSGYSHLGKVVGWRYFKDHGWRRDKHTRTAQPASGIEFAPSSPYRFLADEPGRYLGSGAF